MPFAKEDLEQESSHRQQPYDGTLLVVKLCGATRDEANADFIIRSAYPNCHSTTLVKEGEFSIPGKTSRVIFCGTIPSPEMYEYCEKKTYDIFILHDQWSKVAPEFIKPKHIVTENTLSNAAKKYLDFNQPDWRTRFNFSWMQFWDYHESNYAGLNEAEQERAKNIVFGLIERSLRFDQLRDIWNVVEEERMEKIGKGPIGQRMRREAQRVLTNSILCEAELAGNKREGRLFRENLDYSETLARIVANLIYTKYGDATILVVLLGADYKVEGSEENKRLFKNALIFARRVDFTKAPGYVSGEGDLARFLFEGGEDDLSKWLEYDRERTC